MSPPLPNSAVLDRNKARALKRMLTVTGAGVRKGGARMRRLSFTKLVILGCCVWPWLGLSAQEVASDSAMVNRTRELLRSDLRRLVIAQEAYYAADTTYSNSVTLLGQRFRPSPGVTVVVLTASKSGHSAIAIDTRVAGLVCAIKIGNAPPPLNEPAKEGTPTCRGP